MKPRQKPTILTISPSPAAAGATVTITGTGFSTEAVVKFGAVTATVTVVSGSQITATVPSGTGAVRVAVQTAYGVSTAKAFNYYVAPPVVIPPVSAITSLQAAINAATSGSRLTVPAGIYAQVEIPKPLILAAQPGAMINAAGVGRGFTIKSSDVTIEGPWMVKGFTFCGIYANGRYQRLTVRGPQVDGGNRAVFDLHFQDDTGYGLEDITLENLKLWGVTSSAAYNYPAHGAYLKVVRRLIMRNVDAGYTAGVGTHSGIDLCDVNVGLIENCVGHHSSVGIAVNQYPGAGCKSLTFRNSGGHDNSKADRFEYGVNMGIIWDATCYGKWSRYPA